MQDYHATQDISLDGYRIKAGDKVGSGQVGEFPGEGSFNPSSSYPRIGLGHIQAHLASGLIVGRSQKKTEATFDVAKPTATFEDTTPRAKTQTKRKASSN